MLIISFAIYFADISLRFDIYFDMLAISLRIHRCAAAIYERAADALLRHMMRHCAFIISPMLMRHLFTTQILTLPYLMLI
jgi:hypothetical protein